MAEDNAKEGALASRGKRRKKERKKRMHQRGEIFQCVDHCGERRDKLVKETNELTTWHDI